MASYTPAVVWRFMILIFAFVGALGGYYWRKSEEVAEVQVPEVETVVVPTPSVVTALRDVARLEGAVAHIERVVDLKERQSRFYGLVDAEDAILLVAVGNVTAGVDLSKVRDRDVVINKEKGSVSILLPQAAIFSSSLDQKRTYVHTRQTDTLAKRQEHLETKARREAERTLEHAAIESGVLPRAERSVATTVEALARSLGYEQIHVDFRRPPGEGMGLQ